MSRQVLVLGHTGRPEVLRAGDELLTRLIEAGFQPVLGPVEAAGFPHADVKVVNDPEDLMRDLELVVVLGGDGTILRAAELARGSSVPLLGVNLGHVGFLAEFEREDLAEAVDRLARGEFTVEERMTLDVEISVGGEVVERTWALNEAALEKEDRGRMIEVVTEVDGRPVASFGADGIVMATPTGSTAYSFSAGGPIVWPEVEALLMAPIAAHTLFPRPLVTAPTSVLAVEVLDRSNPAVLWCDGRRMFHVLPGSRIEVRRGLEPVRLARLVEGPFTDRLVRKFHLPVTGWRGPSQG